MPDALVRQMTEADLEQVLQWRNHPAVRSHMFDPRDIALADHRAWFARQNDDALATLLVFEREGRPSGFIQLHERRGQRAGEWGFYAAPDAPRGSGRLLGRATMNHAFQQMGWHKVNGLTLASNERSIRLHQALGFRLEGQLREHHFNGTAHVDVCSFGLLASEWTGKEEKT